MGISDRIRAVFVVVLAVVGLAGPAAAATINLGSIDQPTSVAISGMNDSYAFTVNEPTTFTATVSDPGAPASLTVDLLEVYDLSGFHGVTFDSWLTSSTGGLLTFTKSVGLLTGRLYVLLVTVSPLDSPGYSGTLDFQIAATPIPPAMLLFGTALAGLGVMRWRRGGAGRSA